jgi:hypothetical protein
MDTGAQFGNKEVEMTYVLVYLTHSLIGLTFVVLLNCIYDYFLSLCLLICATNYWTRQMLLLMKTSYIASSVTDASLDLRLVLVFRNN